LFAGAAGYYARYRPGYPAELVAEVVRRFALKGSGRLLDLGCGTGQVTIPLASHVREAVGVDPELDMLIEAAGCARAAGVGNIRWVRGHAEDLPPTLGQFQLVTIGRAVHWMNRRKVLNTLAGMLVPSGGLVIAGDSCLVRPATAWQRAIEAVQSRFLGPAASANGTLLADEDHEMVLRRYGFRCVERTVYEFSRRWSVETVLGYLYSTSLPLRQLLGERLAAFEREITAVLLASNPRDEFFEPVHLEVVFARSPAPPTAVP
jgi:SAM-dependent methyltransferase